MPLNSSVKQNKKSFSTGEDFNELLKRANEIADKMTDKTIAQAFIKSVEYLMSIYDPSVESFIRSREIGLNQSESIKLLPDDDDHYSF